MLQQNLSNKNFGLQKSKTINIWVAKKVLFLIMLKCFVAVI